MVSKKARVKAEDEFREIRFPGTELRLGKSPGSFKAKENKGLDSFGEIKFQGTESTLGSPPKSKSNIFDLGPLPKGIDSTLAFPSSFSKKGKGRK